MILQTQSLLNALTALTKEHIRFAEMLQTLPETALIKRPGSEGWNALECIEHLNRYGAYYLDAIHVCVHNAGTGPAATYRPGWLGNYFSRIIHPDTSPKNRKTLKPMDPLDMPLTRMVLDAFIRHQGQLTELLDKAGMVHLGREKTGTSLSKRIRLKLGDTLRFVVYHNERHIRQAKRALAGTAGNICILRGRSPGYDIYRQYEFIEPGSAGISEIFCK